MARKKKNIRVPFTEEELQMIREAPLTKLKDLAFVMGREFDSLRRKKWAMENKDRDLRAKLDYKKRLLEELPAKQKNTRWSVKEEDLIMNSDLTDVEIAKQLGRTVGSVQTKRNRLIKDKQHGRNKRRADGAEQVPSSDQQS
jgi:hypothetical protein